MQQRLRGKITVTANYAFNLPYSATFCYRYLTKTNPPPGVNLQLPAKPEHYYNMDHSKTAIKHYDYSMTQHSVL